MRRLLALGLGCLASFSASGEDLLTIFDQAVVNDPTVREAEFARKATREAEMIVMCHAGGRSMRVAQFLSNQGFTNVANLSGGISAWSQAVDATVPQY